MARVERLGFRVGLGQLRRPAPLAQGGKLREVGIAQLLGLHDPAQRVALPLGALPRPIEDDF